MASPRPTRWLAIAASTVLVLTACSGGDDPSTDDSSAPSSALPATSAPDEPATGSAAPSGSASAGPIDNSGVPGVTDTSVRLGTTLPITGVAATAGLGLVAGIQMAVDEANASGGIDGRTLELVALDDGFDPPRLVANARRLIEEEQVYAMASPAGSQALPGIWDFVADAGTVVWGPVSPQDPKIQQTYILGPGRGEQLRICTDYAAEQGLTKIGLIGQDNELGEEGNAGVEAGTAANGLDYVGFERVEVLSQDVSSAVSNLRNAGAEAIMLATDNVQAALVMQETDKLGYDAFLCADNGGGGTGGPNSVDPAGDAADGFVGALQVELPTNLDNEAVAAWDTLAEAYTGQGADAKKTNFSLQTYYYTRALLEVFDRMEGDYAYDNFHAVAEASVDEPIDLQALPTIACGSLPDGHKCASGAALAEYDASNQEWTVIRDFQAPLE